jgi:MFS family permease
VATGTFRAFQSRNYRLFFSGQSVSLIGTWMQRTAVSWVIYTMTHSSFMLGVAIFAGQFPSFLLSLFGGVVSDRRDRYKVLLFTQAASMVQALLLSILILSHHASVFNILTLSVMLGIINAFDVPARQSLIYAMVDDKADLPNAIALNSSMVNLARLIGPAVSGIVLQALGAGICFLVNGLSFVAVITSLLLMKLPAFQKRIDKKNALTDLKEGFTYLKQTPTIRNVILMLACISLLVLPFNTLLPVYAKEIFKGNAATFGYINSFIGLGAVGGTFFLASLKDGTDLRRILLITTFVFGVGLIAFSNTSYFPLAMLFAVISGFGMMTQTTLSNSIIQTTVTPAMRGRVVSFFAMAFFGMLPLGSLLIGAISSRIGAPATILSEGIIAVAIAFISSYRVRLKRLEQKDKEHIHKADSEALEVV